MKKLGIVLMFATLTLPAYAGVTRTAAKEVRKTASVTKTVAVKVFHFLKTVLY